MKRKIIFIHSLNNYTGSPKLLSQVVRSFCEKGYNVEVMTSTGEGFLSNISGADYRFTHYRWTHHAVLTAILLFVSQIEMFFRCLFGSNKHIYYINTIIPFGAMLGCWVSNKNSVIHVHEDMSQRKPLYLFLRQVYAVTNRKNIFVSRYLLSTAINCRDHLVAPNALEPDFVSIANSHIIPIEKRDTILMIAALRRYKGIYEFANLAKLYPQYHFELVLSAPKSDVDEYYRTVGQPSNLSVFFAQTDIHPFYQRARVLLQLSNPQSWIESFGLTILEAMTYGIPSIVPNVGGPIEIVTDSVSGYCVDTQNINLIKERLERLMTDETLYRSMSYQAHLKSTSYSMDRLINQIEQYIQ